MSTDTFYPFFQSLKILHNSTEFLPYVIFVGHPMPALAVAAATPSRDTCRRFEDDDDEDGVEVVRIERAEAHAAESDTNSERTVVVVVPETNGGVTITANGHTGISVRFECTIRHRAFKL